MSTRLLLVVLALGSFCLAACSAVSIDPPPLATAPAPGSPSATPSLLQPTASLPPVAASPSPQVEVVFSPGGRRVDFPALTRIDMLDGRRGWAVGVAHVMSTTDGGVSWVDATPQGLVLDGLSLVFFAADAQQAWFVLPASEEPGAGTLYRTTDGGRSWQVIPVPFGRGDLAFVDGSSGWMMADLGAGAGSMGVAIFTTADGGLTWSQAFSHMAGSDGGAGQLPLSGLKTGIAPLDARRALITGTIYESGTIYLFRSEDAGRSWQLQDLLPPAGYEDAQFAVEKAIVFSSRNVYLPLLFYDPGTSEPLLGFLSTRNGGDNWSVIENFIARGRVASFASPSTGVVWNGAEFLVTTDSAQSWETVTPNEDFSLTFLQMDFVSASEGFLVTTDGSLFVTRDGAYTWELLIP